MSAAAVIDSLEFARAQREIRGTVLVASLARLHDVLFDSQGSLGYELRGTRDARNRPQLALTVNGRLHLQCQRCLGRLEHVIAISSVLLLVHPSDAIDEDLEDPEAPDVIEASAELEVAGLVEDEVLLSLPLAPRHAEGTCESRLERPADASAAARPFAQLAALKQPRNTR